MITDRQKAKIAVLFRPFADERGARLRALRRFFGQEIDSMNLLTKQEASRFISYVEGGDGKLNELGYKLAEEEKKSWNP